MSLCRDESKSLVGGGGPVGGGVRGNGLHYIWYTLDSLTGFPYTKYRQPAALVTAVSCLVDESLLSSGHVMFAAACITRIEEFAIWTTKSHMVNTQYSAVTFACTQNRCSDDQQVNVLLLNWYCRSLPYQMHLLCGVLEVQCYKCNVFATAFPAAGYIRAGGD
jgi:hypothetical protein